MSNLIEMLGCKTEEEAILKVQQLAAVPVSVTLVGTADGSLFISTTGDPPVALVEQLLLRGLQHCIEQKVHASLQKTKTAPN
jgi:hypothetical protein